jgi:hypothetical protein
MPRGFSEGLDEAALGVARRELQQAGQLGKKLGRLPKGIVEYVRGATPTRLERWLGRVILAEHRGRLLLSAAVAAPRLPAARRPSLDPGERIPKKGAPNRVAKLASGLAA